MTEQMLCVEMALTFAFHSREKQIVRGIKYSSPSPVYTCR